MLAAQIRNHPQADASTENFLKGVVAGAEEEMKTMPPEERQRLSEALTPSQSEDMGQVPEGMLGDVFGEDGEVFPGGGVDYIPSTLMEGSKLSKTAAEGNMDVEAMLELLGEREKKPIDRPRRNSMSLDIGQRPSMYK